MAVLADADTRARGLRAPIEAFSRGELIMRNFIYDRGFAAGIEQGRIEAIEKRRVEAIEKGRVEVVRAYLLETLHVRRLRLGPSQRARIERETHEDVLRQWFLRALVAGRTAELFTDPA